MFAQGNDNPIFKTKPETHLVDNNMLVIGLYHRVHGQFLQLKSCYDLHINVFDKSNSIPEEHKLSIFF